MEIKFYQAECGDAAKIRFLGTDQKYHNIIVDSGYERTFRHVLADEIKEIETQKEAIDLWVISHIHDDHIGGVTSYIKSIKLGEIDDAVNSWFYNVPRVQKLPNSVATSSISEAKSISQGDLLLEYLSKKRVRIQDITNDAKVKEFYGLRISILSPDTSTLAKLRLKYSERTIEMERNEIDSVSLAKAAPKHDYHLPLDKFDLKKWNEDDSIENRSSIAFITEFENKRILWLADAHPSVIVTKLKELGYSKSKQIKCDWVKVTHHGSRGNNSDELFEMISCENYLLSANGENIHCLPTKECISRILNNAQRPHDSHYRFFFTYKSKLLLSMFDVDGVDVFNRFNFSMHFPMNGDKMINVLIR